MERYNENINLLFQSGIIESKDEVYLPVEDNYLKDKIDFYQRYLEIKSFKLSNPVFILGSDNSLNAWATSFNSCNVICINQKVFSFIEECFEVPKPQIIKYLIERNIRTYYDNGLLAIELMKQLVITFLFYHELGHLVQEQDPPLFGEYTDEIFEEDKYHPIKHLSEYDADLYAIKRIATHIIKIYNREEGILSIGLRSKFIEDLIVLLISSYLIYRMNMINGYGEFYTNKHSHPHMIIRINALAIHLINAISENVDFELRIERILEESINLVEELSTCLSMDLQLDSFRNMGKDHIEEIKDYLGILNYSMLENQLTAYNKTKN